MSLPESMSWVLCCCTPRAADATSEVVACYQLYCSSPDCQVSMAHPPPSYTTMVAKLGHGCLRVLHLECRCPQFLDWIPGQPAS